MPLQLWVQAARAGLTIREIPIRLIYNDPNRYFGGDLDDHHIRLMHYVNVIKTEMGGFHCDCFEDMDKQAAHRKIASYCARCYADPSC
jgi:hypothetical protein